MFRDARSTKTFKVEDISREAQLKKSKFFLARKNDGVRLVRKFKKNPYSRNTEHNGKETMRMRDYLHKILLRIFDEYAIDLVKISGGNRFEDRRYEIFSQGKEETITLVPRQKDYRERAVVISRTEDDFITNMLTDLYELFTEGHFKLIKEALKEQEE